MSTRRLDDVVQAFGADPRRWPAADRHLAARSPAFPDAEVALDDVLATSRPPEVSAALRGRVLAQAEHVLRGRRRAWRWSSPMAWMSTVGWAGAACAGVVFGLNLTTSQMAEAQIEAVLNQSALAGVDDEEVLG